MALNGRKLKRYRDISSIRSLYRLSNLLCVAPRFDFEKRQCVTSIKYNCYAFLMFAITIGAFVWSFRGRWIYVVPGMTLPTMVLDLASCILVTATNCLAIIKLSFWRNGDFKKFLKLLMRYDHESSVPVHLNCKQKRGFYMEMVGYHCFLFTFCAFDSYVWTTGLGFAQSRYYTFRFLQYYQLMTLSVLIHNYIIIIRDRYAHINEKLKSSFFFETNQKIMTVTDKLVNRKSFKDNWVVQLTRLYSSICDMVELINGVFGMLFMLLITNLILGLLQPLNLAIVYSSSELNGASFGPDMAALCVLWASLFSICGVLIATSCDQAVKEAKQTSFLSYKLTQDLSLRGLKLELRDDLILLGQHASLHAPQFTACGFFTINNTLLLSIFGSVTGYLIVLIQLN